MAGGGCLLLSLLRLDSGGSAPARGFGKLTSLQFCPPLRLLSSVVHPLSIRTPQASPGSQLRLGLPAAPEAYYLPLLPSGPDGVRSASPRRAGSSTLLSRAVPAAPEPRAGIQPRYSGLRVQGTASSPSSTTDRDRRRRRKACQANVLVQYILLARLEGRAIIAPVHEARSGRSRCSVPVRTRLHW